MAVLRSGMEDAARNKRDVAAEISEAVVLLPTDTWDRAL